MAGLTAGLMAGQLVALKVGLKVRRLVDQRVGLKVHQLVVLMAHLTADQTADQKGTLVRPMVDHSVGRSEYSPKLPISSSHLASVALVAPRQEHHTLLPNTVGGFQHFHSYLT